MQWRCYNTVSNNKKAPKKCDTRVSFRSGTFFARSQLTIQQILGFVNLWVDNVQLKVIAKQIEINYKTAVDFASFCREVVFQSFIVNCKKLGGPGMIVEIDESKFGKVKKVKGHRGKPVDGQWIFGIYERGSGRVVMVAVEDR